MNSTLTEFVKHLGKTGKCKVEETPKGWFITYIDRDSETLFKERAKKKRKEMDLAEEEKQGREIMKQIERVSSQAMPNKDNVDGAEGGGAEEASRELKVESGVKIGFALGGGVKKEKGESSKVVFEDVEDEKKSKKVKSVGGGSGGARALEELMREEERKKERVNRKDYWVCEGIIVKVMSKVLAEKGYYKQKGVVKKVIDRYVGEIEMLESKHVLRVDQQELETVIPQIGCLVKIVNGAYRGSNARLLAVDTDRFCAKVKMEKGIYDGKVLNAVEYEDICKLA